MNAHQRNALLKIAGSLSLTLVACAPSFAQVGDLGPDDKLNIQDATLSLQIAVGVLTPTSAQIEKYDFAPYPGVDGRLYGDGKLTISDVVSVLQQAVGTTSRPGPAVQTQLYTLNGAAGSAVPGNASLVDLNQLRAGNLAGSITPVAFKTGVIPTDLDIVGNEGFLVNAYSHSLEFVNLTTLKDDGLPLYLGTDTTAGATPTPQQVAVVNGKAYVTLQVDNTVAVVDIASRRVINRIPVGPAPSGIATVGNQVFVANSAFSFDPVKGSQYGQGSLTVIDAATDTVIGTVDLPTNPTFVRVDYGGRLHVSSSGNYADQPGVVSILIPRAGQVPEVKGSIPVGGAPGPMAFTPNGMAYVASGFTGVMKYDPNTLQVLRGADNPISLKSSARPEPSGPVDLVADYDGKLYAALFVPDLVDVIDSKTDTLALEIPVGDGPEALTIR